MLCRGYNIYSSQERYLETQVTANMPRKRLAKRPRPVWASKRRRAGGRSLARRKAKKFGRKWKSPGIPRTIISSDFQRRTQAVNFDYTMQWCVSPQIIGQTGGAANRLQFVTFVMNDPTGIFGAGLPFGVSNAQTVAALPNYAQNQRAYGDDGTTVYAQVVNNFATWAARYEKAMVIGSKVTAVLRPKMVYRTQEAESFTTAINGAANTQQAFPAVDTVTQALDASRVATILTDAKPFDTDAESLQLTSKIPQIIERAGVKSHRMSYTPGGKDGAFATINYSPKKFDHLNSLKDNNSYWSDINRQTNRLTMTNTTAPGATAIKVKPVYGVLAIQKEELSTPTAGTPDAGKIQHDYYVECKYQCTVLFKDPYEIDSTNVPTAGPVPPGRGRMGNQF